MTSENMADDTSDSEHWPFAVASISQFKDLNDGKLVASDAGATISGVSDSNFLEFLLDLVIAVALGLLQQSKFIEAVNAAGLTAQQVATCIPELLWMAFMQYEGKSEIQERLAALARSLFEQEKWVTKKAFKEILEPEALMELGLITSPQNFKGKEIKTNTKLFYTQTKYNLFRECSEGFSKLLTLLLQQGSLSLKEENYKATEEQFKAIMGAFNLDPLRVLDVILEAFAQQPKAVIYTKFSLNFTPALIQNNLGFRFQQCKKDGKGAPPNLCLVTAGLIKDQQVSLEAILGHTEPQTDDIRTLAAHAQTQFSQAINKIGSMGSRGPANLDGKGNAEKQFLNGMMLHKAENMEISAPKLLAASLSGVSAESQQLPLLEGLILVGSWGNAKRLISHLEALGLVPMQFENVARALCKTIRKQVEPMAKALLPNGIHGPSILDEEVPTTEPKYLSEELLEMLEFLDIYLYNDQRLWTQLCHLMRHIIKYNLHQMEQNPSAEVKERLEQAEDFVLGSLMAVSTLFPPSAAVVAEVWAIVKLYPFHLRAKIYEAWQELMNESLVTTAQTKLAVVEARKILRRLAVTGNDQSKKNLNRHFATYMTKLVHVAPFSVLSTVISQVESYGPAMIEPILDSMRHFTKMAFDILTFLFLERFTKDKRAKVKADGTNTADWLKALSGFIAGVCRRYYHHINMTLILQCMTDKLKAYKTQDLILLSELIKSMSCIQAVSNISETQADACAGGPLLRTEIIYVGFQKVHKHLSKTRQALADAIQSASTDCNYIVLLAKNIEALQATCDPETPIPEAKDVKYLALQVDTLALLLIQLLEFFRTALSSEQYAAMVPSMSDLVKIHQLRPQTALVIHRPLVSKLSPPVMANSEDGEIASEAAEALKLAQTPEKAKATKEAEKGSAAWQSVVSEVKEIFPGQFSPEGYLLPEWVIMFWSLSYSDIFFPEARYKNTEAIMQQDIKTKIQQVEVAKQNEESARRQTEDNRRRGLDEVVHKVDQIDIIATELEIARLKEVVRKLPSEAKKQAAHVKEVNKKLQRIKEPASRLKTSNWISRYFVDTCIIPRILQSTEDAMFCAAFIEKMNLLEMPNFHTVNIMLWSLKALMPQLMIATDFEAQNLGMFLNAIYQLVKKWDNAKLFEEQCANKWGFRLNPTETATLTQAKLHIFVKKTIESHLIARFLAHLQSSDYSCIKNSLDVLSKTIKVFPKSLAAAEQLKAAAWQIVQKGESGVETRDDIKRPAKNYHDRLGAEMKSSSRFPTTPTAAKPAIRQGKASQPNGRLPPSGVSKSAAPAAGQSKTTEKPASGVSQGPAQESGVKRPREEDVQVADEVKPKSSQTANSSLRPDAPEFKPRAPAEKKPRADTAQVQNLEGVTGQNAADEVVGSSPATAEPVKPPGRPSAKDTRPTVKSERHKAPEADRSNAARQTSRSLAPEPRSTRDSLPAKERTQPAKEPKPVQKTEAPAARPAAPATEVKRSETSSRRLDAERIAAPLEAFDRRRETSDRRRDAPEGKVEAAEPRKEDSRRGTHESRRDVSAERERNAPSRRETREPAESRRSTPDVRKEPPASRHDSNASRRDTLDEQKRPADRHLDRRDPPGKRKEGSEGRSDSRGKRDRDDPEPKERSEKKARQETRPSPEKSKAAVEPVPEKRSTRQSSRSKRDDSSKPSAAGDEGPASRSKASSAKATDGSSPAKDADARRAEQAAEEKAREDALKAFQSQQPASPPVSARAASPPIQDEPQAPAPSPAPKRGRAAPGLFKSAMLGIAPQGPKVSQAPARTPVRERPARKAKASEEPEEPPVSKKPRTASVDPPSPRKSRESDEDTANVSKRSKDSKEKKKPRKSKKEKKEKKGKRSRDES